MNEISRLRFDALASYARSPEIALFARELRWFEFDRERLLAAVVLDSDEEYSVVFMAKDLRERYRGIRQSDFFDSLDALLADLPATAERVLEGLDEERAQGDDIRPPVDFFAPLRPSEQLNPAFVHLATEEGFSPAREIIQPMMRWHEDVDGNFVEQFQTTGFHPRIWELYLFAAFNEAGFVIDQSKPAPDLILEGLDAHMCVEATTINPSLDSAGNVVPPPSTDTPEAEAAYMREYLPIRYAGALIKKLEKRYWERAHVQDKPLVFAIQDFHAPMSMTWSRSGLVRYLYGYDHLPSRTVDGDLVITPQAVEKHGWGSKEVASGFFMLPGSEHVSAVIFNASATISKFNRIGHIAGFGSQRVRLIRQGTVVDRDPNASEPRTFAVEVRPGTYNETWVEGMDVFHNPSAKHPLDPEVLPGAAHHHLRDDRQIGTVLPEWYALASLTHIFVSREGEE
ncbi:MAG: hypothetical protein M3277_06725 [Actinomycetota bacterium]|nr:hypothetical protein [Actinomycetota bacterium]